MRVGGAEHALTAAGGGVHEARVDAAAGDDYGYVARRRRAARPRHAPPARGPARPVAGRRSARAFAWTDAGWTAAARTSSCLRAARRHVHAGGHVRRGDRRTCRRSRELGVTAIELMPVAEFPGRHGWGYDGVYLSRRAVAPTAAPRACSGSSTPPTPAASASSSTSSTTTSAPGQHGATPPSARTSPTRYTTPWGEALELRRRALGAPCASGCCRPPSGWVRDFHLDGLRLDAIHAIYDAGADHILAELAERVHAVRPGALVIAESDLNDPRVIRPREPRRLGLRRRTGPTTSTTRCAPCSPASARATTRTSAPSRTWPRRSAARTCTPAATRRSASAASARRPTTAPPTPVRRLRPEPRPGRQPRARRPAARRGPGRSPPLHAAVARSRRCCSWARSTASRRPSSSSPTTSTRSIADATREGRRREFAAFAAFAGEEVPDPQDPATFARSKLTREARPGAGGALPRPARAAPRACRDGRAAEATTRTSAGCASAAGRRRDGLRQLSPQRAVPWPARARVRHRRPRRPASASTAQRLRLPALGGAVR